MSTIKTLGGILFVAGLFVSLNLLQAQNASVINGVATTIQAAAPDSIVQVTAEAQGLQLVAPDQVPADGTFWMLTTNGMSPPFPCPPRNPNFPVYDLTGGGEQFLVDETGGQVAIGPDTGSTAEAALTAQADAVVGLINQIQDAEIAQLNSELAAAYGLDDGMDMMMDDSSSGSSPMDPNGLWLEITNVANGWSSLNLHNGTNFVYAILTKTNLLDATWNVEAELFPTGDQTNVMPFAVQNFDRQILFLRALDWTGVTENGNTTPDWWFWEYYGTTALSDTNLDSQGNPLVYDYTNGLDPNIISFSLQTANPYVNLAFASLQLNIAAGTPSYYAVLVNDTNLADANWQPYTTSALTTALGSTNGVYVVTVGLRGLPANATTTWARLALTLDTTPPSLTLTNLGTLSGSRPFIDPAGFTTKALSAVSYTVIDANGVTNTGTGLVVAQGFNVNDPYHVTNWIQCLDLALALGTNQISIQTTDWAGNVAVTNFSYVFDTNGDVTAPALSLAWPPAGMTICGNSLTVQGTLDDDTATASLQYTDTNGTLQTITGLVERGGNLWFENVPLAAGTNSFTIQARDAVGNVSSTNVTVVQSPLSMSINSLDNNSINYAYATVTGTVSDPSATVTVNGVAATVNGNNWSAPNVPLAAGGTVMLAAVASGSSSGALLLEQERGPVVFTQSYSYALNDSYSFDGTNYSTDSMSFNWTRNGGGTYVLDQNSTWYDYWTGPRSSHDLEMLTWPADNGYWPVLAGTDSEQGYTNGVLANSGIYTNQPLPDVEWMEQSASSGSWAANYHTAWVEKSGREIRLFTGGKAVRQRQSLFDLSAGLIQTDTVDVDTPHWWLFFSTGGFLSWDYAPTAVPAAEIALGTLGNLGSDGHLWQVLANGQEVVITPTVAGGTANSQTVVAMAKTTAPTSSANTSKSNSGNLPGQTKYTPTITANNNVTLDPDNVVNGADFCVGQGITFDISGLFSGYLSSSRNDAVVKWTLPGVFVNTNSDPNCNLFYEENPAFLGKVLSRDGSISTSCWYVLNTNNATVKVDVNLFFGNGNAHAQLPIIGKINVHRPTATNGTPYQPDGAPIAQIVGNFLSLGTWGPTNDMSFSHTITADNFTSGQVGYFQLISGQ